MAWLVEVGVSGGAGLLLLGWEQVEVDL